MSLINQVSSHSPTINIECKKAVSISGFIIPVLLVLFLIFIFPLGNSFWLSFHRWNLITPPRLIGFRNYLLILSDPVFWISIRNTAVFSGVSFCIEITLAFFIAQLLNHKNVKGRAVWHAIFILPMMLTPVVLSSMWRAYLNREFGIANFLLTSLNLPAHAWTMESETAIWTLIFVEVWHKTSFFILVISAGIVSLPKDVFEAVEIDGASYWQRTKMVTIPMLVPIFRVAGLFQMIELIRIFDKVYILTEGGPGRSTSTLSFIIFERSFHGWQMGEGAATSYLLILITMTVAVFLIRGVRAEVMH
jgi:multiple sugar transport system permease protein